MNQIELAKEIATEAHKGQIRKRGEDKGKPYIIHPERVAFAVEIELGKLKHYGSMVGWERFKADNSIAAAWLHDTLEDTKLGISDLVIRGVLLEVIGMVKILTRKEDETYLDFILRIKDDYYARLVKICDIRDNMKSLEEGSLKDKYRLALHILNND